MLFRSSGPPCRSIWCSRGRSGVTGSTRSTCGSRKFFGQLLGRTEYYLLATSFFSSCTLLLYNGPAARPGRRGETNRRSAPRGKAGGDIRTPDLYNTIVVASSCAAVSSGQKGGRPCWFLERSFKCRPSSAASAAVQNITAFAHTDGVSLQHHTTRQRRPRFSMPPGRHMHCPPSPPSLGSGYQGKIP